jgi:hypothetical protein
MACVLAACSAPTVPQQSSATVGPGGAPALQVSLMQSRMDEALVRMSVLITNTSEATISVRSLTLHSPRLTSPAQWKKGAKGSVAAGRTVAFHVSIPEVVCDGQGGESHVDLVLMGNGALTLAVNDSTGHLTRIVERACFAKAVERVATLKLDDEIESETVNGSVLARVTMTIERRGPGLAINQLRGTTLFAQADDHGRRLESRPIVGSPSKVVMTLIPNRCDAHAIAEDKKGTIFPVDVTINGVSSVLAVAAGPVLRERLRQHAAIACHLR